MNNQSTDALAYMNEIRDFCVANGITSETQWHKFAKSKSNVFNYPISVDVYFKRRKVWISYYYLFGTESHYICFSGTTKEYLAEIKKCCIENNILSLKEWETFAKSDANVLNYPTYIKGYFKRKGMLISHKDLFTQPCDQNYLNLQYAKEIKNFCNTNKIFSITEWMIFARSKKNINKYPIKIKDYFSKRNILIEFLSGHKTYQSATFKECSNICQKYKIRSLKEWIKFIDSNDLESFGIDSSRLCKNMNRPFMREGIWNTKEMFYQKDKYASYEEHQQYALLNKITSQYEWMEHTKLDSFPENFYTAVDNGFKRKKLWSGWPTFLQIIDKNVKNFYYRYKNINFDEYDKLLHVSVNSFKRAGESMPNKSAFIKHQINKIYLESAKKTILSDIVHVVDHIDPLKHNLVCGIHCVSNLICTTKSYNNTKLNYFIPYHIDFQTGDVTFFYDVPGASRFRDYIEDDLIEVIRERAGFPTVKREVIAA